MRVQILFGMLTITLFLNVKNIKQISFINNDRVLKTFSNKETNYLLVHSLLNY